MMLPHSPRSGGGFFCGSAAQTSSEVVCMKETGPKCHGAIEDVYGILTFATTVLNFELIHLAIRVYAKHWFSIAT